jgi:uncharacterized membrane protein
MITTDVTRAVQDINAFKISLILFIMLIIIELLIIISMKKCKRRRYVALIGFLSGFIIDAFIPIYFWVKGFSWKKPFNNVFEALSYINLPDTFISIIIYLAFPVFCLILAVITILLSKNSNSEKVKTKKKIY